MSDDVDALSIYRDLPMDVKVTLLERPHGPIPGELVPRLSKIPSTYAAMSTFVSNPSHPDSDSAFTLHGDLPDRLERIRERLDQWWSTLDAEVQDYLARNRKSELDGHYKDAVMSAGDGTVDGLIVSVVQDNQTGMFRLPDIVHVYVELKARE